MSIFNQLPLPGTRPPVHLKPASWRWLMAAVMAVGLNAAGLAPELAAGSITAGLKPALAQSDAVSEAEIRGYANSVLQMDSPRTAALNQIQALLSGVNYNPAQVDMTCPNTRNLNQLPRQVRSEVREIIVNYCNQARAIVEENGLTVRRFNSITEAHQSDTALAERIRTALIQIQQSQS
jgi:Domain of unknown function (DUF4168)